MKQTTYENNLTQLRGLTPEQTAALMKSVQEIAAQTAVDTAAR